MRLKLLMAAAMLSVSLAAHGGPVTIVSGSLTASVDGNPTSVSSPNGLVTAYGTYNPSTSTSTTTGVALSSQIAFTFNQAFELLDTSTGGSANADFSVLAGTLYSILDPAPVFSSEGISADSFDTILLNLTTDTTLYSTNSGGSLTGTFVAGDEYSFASSSSVTAASDPSLTYAPSISFAAGTAVTPEPSSFLMLGTGLLGVAGMMRKRFA